MNDEEQEGITWKSGWEYIKEKHLGTLIFVGFIVVAVGLIYLSTFFTDNSQPDCQYTVEGCQADNRWGQ